MATNHKCCDRQNVRKGLWSPEEDEKLVSFINKYGHGCWSTLPKYAGLERCGKSCRLRWINYLRPDLKRGTFTPQEAALVIECHKLVGNRWSHISHFLPGRTDNEIKNFWNSGLKKKIVAHQKHVQSLKKAAAMAAAAVQNQNLYYVNPNQQINHHMSHMNSIIVQAPVTLTQNFALNMPPPIQVYVPAPVEVQAPVPVQASPFSDPPAAWPVPDYNPEIFSQDNQNLVLNYQYDDDFISLFDDPNPPFLNDGNLLNPNQDSSPPPVVISFLPELDTTGRKELGLPLSSAAPTQILEQPVNTAVNQEINACGIPEMKVPRYHIDFIGFGESLSSAAQGQALDQPLPAENQAMHAYGSCEMEVPAHHINFIESLMASFVASTPSSTSSAAASNYKQLEYNLMAPSPNSETLRMDAIVATPSSSWDFSEFE